MPTHILNRHDTAANWTAANPVLQLGEIGVESDTKNLKVGDGTTRWTALAYALAGRYASVVSTAQQSMAGPLAFGLQTQPQEFWVSKGNKASDANTGERDAPMATLAAAVAAGEATGNPYKVRAGYGTHNIAAADANNNGLTVAKPNTTIEGLGLMTVINITASGLQWGIVFTGSGSGLRSTFVNVSGAGTVAPYWVVGATVPINGSAQNGRFEDVEVQILTGVTAPAIPAGTSTMVAGAFALGPDNPGSAAMDIAGWQFIHCKTVFIHGVFGFAGYVLGNGTNATNVTANYIEDCTHTEGDYVVYCGGAGFRWRGGNHAHARLADFKFVQAPNELVVIEGARGENGAAVIDSQYVGTVQVAFYGGNFSSYTSTGVSGQIVKFQQGHLVLDGVNLTATTNDVNLGINTSSGPNTPRVDIINSRADNASWLPVRSTFYNRNIRGCGYKSGGVEVLLPEYYDGVRHVNPPQTTLNGTTAGTAVSSMPEQGGFYKKFVVFLSGYENTTGVAQTIAFPTAFTNAPVIVTQPAAFGATVSATTLTLPAGMGAPVTGWIIVEGF